MKEYSRSTGFAIRFQKTSNTDLMTPETQKLLIDSKKTKISAGLQKIILGRCPTSYVRLQHPVKPATAFSRCGAYPKSGVGSLITGNGTGREVLRALNHLPYW
ncbi:hypothetical protein CDAR_375751 [Caerostris darwini]|uniref:Uncharacterized protein n=1 Tax=Caerostris darwini TaxID=1538125 RepID=A0AAV4S6N1_9ARAC|nr:hypothetical protein CDAR_375751 [Caerostris darwini]